MKDEFDAIATIVGRTVFPTTETAIVTGVYDKDVYVQLRGSQRHVQVIVPRESGVQAGDEVIVAKSPRPSLERRWHIVGIGKAFDSGGGGADPGVTPHALSGASHTGTLVNAQGPQFPLLDGSRQLTANWDVGPFQVRAETLQSDVATGTAPLTVASTTLVNNLNVGLLGGFAAADYPRKAENATISGGWDFPGGGFTIGSDVLLQRSAANVLATPDTLQVPTITAIANLTLQPAGNIELDPTGDDVLPGSVYTVNIGALTNKFLTLHAAELWVDTIVAHETRASIGGRVLVGPGTTMLAEDIDDSQIDIPVEHNVLGQNHIIHLEGGGQVEFMLVNGMAIGAVNSGAPGTGYFRINSDVTAYFSTGMKFTVTGAATGWNGEWTVQTVALVTGQTYVYPAETIPIGMGSTGVILFTGATGVGPYRHFVTRNHDGSGPNSWSAGSGVFSTGAAGSGWIDIYSVWSMKGSTQDGPTIAGNVRTGSSWNQWVEHWAIGNLDGLYGYGVDTYGVGLGRYASGYNNVTIDSDTGANGGIRFRNYDVTIAQWVGSTLTLGQTGAGNDYIQIDPTNGIRMFVDNTQRLSLAADGTFWLGESGTTERLAWDTTNGLRIFNAANAEIIKFPVLGNAQIVGTLAVSSPGQITAGGGVVTLDAGGIQIEAGASEIWGRGYSFVDSVGTNLSHLWAYKTLVKHGISLKALQVTGVDSHIDFWAVGYDTNYLAEVQMTATSGTKSAYAAVTAEGITSISLFQVYADVVEISGKPSQDPVIFFDGYGTGDNAAHWAIGVDDSDSDRFKICQNDVLGTNDYFEIDTSGNWYIKDLRAYVPIGFYHNNRGSSLTLETTAGNVFSIAASTLGTPPTGQISITACIGIQCTTYAAVQDIILRITTGGTERSRMYIDVRALMHDEVTVCWTGAYTSGQAVAVQAWKSSTSNAVIATTWSMISIINYT